MGWRGRKARGQASGQWQVTLGKDGAQRQPSIGNVQKYSQDCLTGVKVPVVQSAPYTACHSPRCRPDVIPAPAPARQNRIGQRSCDWHLSRSGGLSGKLKHYRWVATGYEKRASLFGACRHSRLLRYSCVDTLIALSYLGRVQRGCTSDTNKVFSFVNQLDRMRIPHALPM